MEVPFATNFNDYVALMAANSPHALVMDWWRRLDLALREYYHALRQTVRPRNRRAMEEAVSLDRVLGPGFADCIRRLRLLRNQVAHEPIYHHSSEDAAGYARHAFTLIAALGRRVSRLEGRHDRTGNPTLEGNHDRKQGIATRAKGTGRELRNTTVGFVRRVEGRKRLRQKGAV